MTQQTGESGWVQQSPIRPGATSLSIEPRLLSLLVAGFATVFLFAVVTILPVPYVVLRPGPVVNTLGTSDSKPLIAISGHPTYPAKGQLDLTTVSLVGGPSQPINLQQALFGWLDGTEAVVPTDDIFPPGQSQQETDRENTQEMVDSQQSAAAAALTELKIPVATRLKVTGLVKAAPAAAVIRADDVLLAVNGQPAADLDRLRAVLQPLRVGQAVTVRIERAGKPSDVTTTTTTGEDGKAALGVFISGSYSLPFSVKIQLNDIGGPSAGMMFALGIIDVLTPGNLTGGKRIAGTGTIDDTVGKVGPIGGIRQKLVGARRAGARYFLAPAGNCNEVVGHVPDGLRVVKVATLAQAHQAVEAIGADRASGLPSCIG